MNIYVDLDSTLIHSLPPGADENPFEGRVIMTCPDGGRYQTALCPHALESLKSLRELASVRLLTVATQSYALAANDLFKLGFTPEEITAREDFLAESRGSAWGDAFTTEFALADRRGIDPTVVLIDDMPAAYIHTYHKPAYLGIGNHQVYHIHPFHGQMRDNPWPIIQRDIALRIAATA